MSPGIPTRLLATQSDERLLALVREGHERAFEALVHRYRKPLLGYCRRLRLSDARAEDIVQLALLKTWIAAREGAEVRDLKAWLYRVVHNTAVNALRDSAHEGESFADPAHALEAHPPHQPAEDSQLDRGLAMREALAEVAALPPLQREVIVRTAVAGHSHEQVASDLGITNGAVRGLLYRARTTLRTGIAALTPPPLLGWLAGRSDQGAPAPERLAELAGGGGAVGVGGAAGIGGLLLKGGAVALTVGTVLTGAAVVHLSASTHHGGTHRLIAAAAPTHGAGAGSAAAGVNSGTRDGGISDAAGAHRGASGRDPGNRGGSTGAHARARIDAAGGRPAGAPTASGGGRAPRPTTRLTGGAHRNASAQAPAAQSPAPGSTTQGSGQAGAGAGAGASQGGGSGQGGGSSSSSGSGGPVGSAAGNGSPGGTDTSGPSEGGASGGGQSGSGSGAGSGSGSGSESGAGGSEGAGSSEGSGSGGSSSGSSSSSGSESSGSEQSGSLVGTVVHEVGNILEHLLH